MKNLFRDEVVANRRRRLDGAVTLMQPPMYGRLGILLGLLLFVGVLFLSTTSFTRKEQVTGFLEPMSGMVKVTASQTGLVRELLVQEGDHVLKGQPLARIESETYGTGGFALYYSQINQYQSRLASLKRQIVFEQADYRLKLQEVEQRKRNLDLQRAQSKQQRHLLEDRIKIKRELVEQLSTLAEAGHITSFEYKSQQDALLALEQQLLGLKADILSLDNQIDRAGNEKESLLVDSNLMLNRLNQELEETETQIATMEQQRLGEVRAPKDGLVTGLVAHVSENVVDGQSLMSLMPKESVLRATIFVPTTAAGFVTDDQQVQIRYHAFPYQRFGVFSGTITEVSGNLILPDEVSIPGIIGQPSYRVLVSLEQESVEAYGRQFHLKPGMLLNADIILEQQTLLQWLLDPIYSLGGSYSE